MFQFLFRAFFASLVIGYPNPSEAYKTDVSQPIVANSSQNKPEKPKLGEYFEEGKKAPCLSYETFKVKHGLPSEITRVLRCLFNQECSQIQSAESGRQNNLSSAKISSEADYAENSFEDASKVANSSSITMR
jgi:hypothetical protein